MEKVKELVTNMYYNGDKTELMYIDFIYKNDGNVDENSIGATVFSKYIQISEPISEKIEEEYLKTVNILSDRSIFKIQLSQNDIDRKWISTILNASNHIAGEGRIGPGKIMLVSENNYNNKNLKSIEHYLQVKFIDSDDYIILYRKNDIDQPGLSLVYNENNYAFIESGFFPEKQFVKINII